METQKLHRLLEKQLNRYDIDIANNPALEKFVNEVNKTYVHLGKEKDILSRNTFRMIEKLSQSNENLQNIIDTIDSFNYHVSHDLKTSIINNISLTRMLKKYYKKGNENRIDDLIIRLKKNSDVGLTIIDRYLEISKFESKINSAKKENFNVKEIALEILDELDLGKKLDLIINEADYTTLFIDAISIRSMIQNFITNAYKYRREGVKPMLRINLRKEDKMMILCFEDNGIGINLEKHKDKIFKPFVRIQQDEIEGSGVGLFIVKKIVTSFGGNIEVKSEVGVGTRFIVKLKQE